MSGYLHDEIQREHAVSDPPPTGPFAGTIAETATTTADQIPVLLDAFDPGLQFGPCRWMPRLTTVTVNVAETGEAAHNITVAQAVLPTRGDRCLVEFDDSGIPWITCWWPT